MKQEALAKWNHHVMSGDILLLSSGGLEALAIEAYQLQKRGPPASFTHVAVVIGADLLVEAVPGKGVCLSRWQDIEEHYNPANCRVARNSRLAENTDAHRLIHERATYYYKQDYKVVAILDPAKELEDQAGIVCSQLVALIFHDIGFDASRLPPMESLPSDVDEATRTTPGWRQFPLQDYGYCNKGALPEAYREEVLRDVQAKLSEEDMKEAKRMADEMLADGGRDNFEEVMARMDASLEKGKAIHERVTKMIVSSMEDGYQLSLKMKELDDAMIVLTRLAVSNIDAGDSRLLEIARSFATQSAGTGADSLTLWTKLFDSEPSAPIFLHQESGADNILEHRKLFAEMQGILKEHFGSNDKLREYIPTMLGNLQTFLEAKILNQEFVFNARTFVDHVLKAGNTLADEKLAEVESRLHGYSELTEKYLARENHSAEGASCLLQMMELDKHRYLWLTVDQPYLEKLSGNLQSMAEFLGTPAGKPTNPTSNNQESREHEG